MNDLNVKDVTNQFDPRDIEANKIMGILAYLGFLVLVPIFAARGSKYAMFHANQGIVLAIAEIVIGILLGILSGIPIIGLLFSLVSGLLGIVILVLLVWGIVTVADGKAKKLPVIGNITLLK